MNYCLIFSIASLLSFSCKNAKESTAAPDNKVEALTEDLNAASNELTTVSQEKEKYRLVVSFYSIGQGIDSEPHQKFVEYLKTNYSEVHFEQVSWGREGEVDYCIKLNELSTKKQEEFIKNIRILLEKSELVHIKENEECVHKR